MRTRRLPVAVAALGLGLFMTMLDSTIVNISIPAMMDDFQVGVSSISWVLDAYLIVLAVLALTAGRLADQFGRKKLYLAGLAVFTVGSFLCAIAGNVGWLIGFRVLQGVGGAVMIPVTMAILTAAFPAEKRGAAMGIWAAIGITAAAIGPSLGGVIVEHLSWNWVFYINIPIGVFARALCWVGVAEAKDPSSPKRLDLVGMGAFCVSVFALVLAVIKGEDWGWASGAVVSLFAAAVVVFAFFLLWEKRQTEPMLDLSLFRSMTFSNAIVCQALVAFGMLGAMFLLTLFLQRILGYSVLRAAVAVTPIPGAALVFAPIAGRLSDKIGTRFPAVGGAAALSLGIYLFTQLGVASTWGDVAWRAVIVGAGMGLANAPLAVAAMASTKAGKEGVGSGVLNTSRMVGMTLGVAICTALLTGAVSSQLTEAKAEVRSIVSENSQIPDQAKSLLLAELDRVGESEGSQAIPDVAALAQERGVPPTLLPQVERLSEQISVTFRAHMTDAFSRVFPWVAVIAAVGIIPAMLLQKPKKRSLESSLSEREAADGAERQTSPQRPAPRPE
jgi:EmrB/QacA subfamily drug resistance transporter